MDLWLGLGVVVVVLALSYFAPRRKCGGCRSCATGCGDDGECASNKLEAGAVECEGSLKNPDEDFETTLKG